MSDKQPTLFPELTPPPGGLQKLRLRLDKERESRHRRAYGVALALASALVIFLVLHLGVGVSWPGSRSDDALQRLILASGGPNPALVRLGLAEAPPAAVTLTAREQRRVALQPVPVADSRVIYYRVVVVNGTNSTGSTDWAR